MSIKILLAEAERNAALLQETVKDSETYRNLIINISNLLACAKEEMYLRSDLKAMLEANALGGATLAEAKDAAVAETKVSYLHVVKEAEEEAKTEHEEDIPTEEDLPVQEDDEVNAPKKCEEETEVAPKKCEEPAKVYTYEDVRGMLGKARTERSVDVNSLIKGMGCEYLSAVPAERYEELLKAAGCIDA